MSGWPMQSAFDAERKRPNNPKPKAGPDLCADCQHERRYHNAAGCGIKQCGCLEFTRTPSVGRVREVAAAFREGYVSGYERGESGEIEDKENAWDRSRASHGLIAPEDEHCACLHDGRGELTNECQEHEGIRQQRDQLLVALQQIVATDYLTNDSGVRQAVLVRWQRALEIAYAAIDKAEGK